MVPGKVGKALTANHIAHGKDVAAVGAQVWPHGDPGLAVPDTGGVQPEAIGDRSPPSSDQQVAGLYRFLCRARCRAVAVLSAIRRAMLEKRCSDERTNAQL